MGNKHLTTDEQFALLNERIYRLEVAYGKTLLRNKELTKTFTALNKRTTSTVQAMKLLGQMVNLNRDEIRSIRNA